MLEGLVSQHQQRQGRMFVGHFLLGTRNGYDEDAGYAEDKGHQHPGSRNEPMNRTIQHPRVSIDYLENFRNRLPRNRPVAQPSALAWAAPTVQARPLPRRPTGRCTPLGPGRQITAAN